MPFDPSKYSINTCSTPRLSTLLSYDQPGTPPRRPTNNYYILVRALFLDSVSVQPPQQPWTSFRDENTLQFKGFKDVPHTLPSQPAWLSRSPGTTRVRSIYPSSRTRPTCGRRLLPASILRMDNPLFSLLKHVQLHLQLALLCPSPRFRRYRHRHLGVSPGHPQTNL